MILLADPRLDFELLTRYRFDRERFLREAAAAARGEATADTALVRGRIEPARDVLAVDHSSRAAATARELGERALARGEVAVVVLNGGMATRFGGVVKGTVEVDGAWSFLGLKARDVARAAARFGRTPPLVLMNSFATDAATTAHLHGHGRWGLAPEDILTFCQSISIRLTPHGELFVDGRGQPSYYAPGHGDFFRSIRESGVLARLRERGVRHLCFSNVDNLGATLDPVLIGHHVEQGWEMTLELTERRRDAGGAWDAGGAPVLVDGRLQVVEGFRFPPGVQETLPDFQTNNMLFDAAAIDRPIPMRTFPVRKLVDGAPALQFEAITCEASGALDDAGRPLLRLGLLRVPREGPHGRFFPIKTPGDLDRSRATLRRRLELG